MPLSSFQEEASKAIVNIFETGRLKGNYGRVTVAANDPGHLSYGKSQTTLASGKSCERSSQIGGRSPAFQAQAAICFGSMKP